MEIASFHAALRSLALPCALALLCACNSRVADNTGDSSGETTTAGTDGDNPSGEGGNGEGGGAGGSRAPGGSGGSDGGADGISGSANGGALSTVGGGGVSTPEPGDAGTDEDDSLYVIANELYATDDSTTYVHVIDTLDSPVVDQTTGVEFGGGRATVRTFNGWVFIAPPLSSVIARYSVAEAGTLTKDGEVGFGNYGIDELTIDEWGNTFISPTKAYLFNAEEAEIIIWNPTTMEILGTVDDGGEDLFREGWGLDGSPAVVRGNRLFRTYLWNNWDEYAWSDEVYLGVYDVETDELVDLALETRCPALSNRIEQDEAGNLYFSNWIWNVGATLVNDAPPSCVLRVNAGEETFDPAWSLSYADIADSREGAMFAYLGDGQALVSVFHDERSEILDNTDPGALVEAEDWRLWTVDLESGEGAPLDGLEWNTGAISTFHVGGRSFLFVPGADWAITRIHEVKDGRAEHNFDVQGWSYQFFKIR